MKAWFKATRAISLTAVLAPAIAVLLSARGVDLWRTVAALLGVSLILIGVNMQNDVEDDRRGIDGAGPNRRSDGRTRSDRDEISFGGSGVLQAGAIASATMQRVAYGLMFTGLLLGVPTVMLAPKEMLALGTLTLIGASGYSGKPFGLKYHALGDITVFLLCGPLLTFGASMAMFGHAVPGVWALGSLFGLAASAILHVNNMQDIEVDRRAGAVTLASLLGPTLAKVFLVLLYAGAIAAWASFRPSWISALGFIPAARLLVRVLPAKDLTVFPLLRIEAAQAHLAIGVAVAIASFVGGYAS